MTHPYEPAAFLPHQQVFIFKRPVTHHGSTKAVDGR
jgi:hypothetical protein